jgi:hypothetical protein
MRQHLPLILLAALFALLIPTRFTDPAKTLLQGLTVPLAWPVNRVAKFAHDRVVSGEPVDDASRNKPRDRELVYRENEQLRQANANLLGQIEVLRQRAEETERLGPVAQYSTRVRVSGVESNNDLDLLATSFGKIEVGQPVIFAGGLAGRVVRAGAGGSVCRLITHKSSRIAGAFLRFAERDGKLTAERLAIDPAVAVGDGGDGLVIASLRLDQVRAAGLSPGRDWFVLADPGWPTILRDYRVGVVESVTPSRDAPLFAEVRIRPAGVLTQLTEVRVLTR